MIYGMLFIQAKPKDRRVYLHKEEQWINNRKVVTKWTETYFDVMVSCNHSGHADYFNEVKVADTGRILTITPDRDSGLLRYKVTGRAVGKTEVIVSISEAGETKSDKFIFEVKE